MTEKPPVKLFDFVWDCVCLFTGLMLILSMTQQDTSLFRLLFGVVGALLIIIPLKHLWNDSK